MNKDLHDIDNLFKQSIDDHLEEVPPEVWQNIDHGLDKRQAAVYKRKYFTVRAAAILLLFVGGVTIAALLRYHSAEKSLDKELVINKVHNNASHSGKEVSNGPALRKVEKEQGTAAQEDLSEVETPGSKEEVKKANSRQYESTENSTYSAEKNSDIAPGPKSKTYNQKRGLKIQTIGAAPKNDVAQRNEVQKVILSGRVSSDLRQDVVDTLARTSYVGIKLLDINAFQINNSPPPVVSISSTLPDLSSSLPAPVAEKSKNTLEGWSISPMYSQNMNLNTLKDDDHFRDQRNNSREAKRTEQESKSFSIGLGVQKELAGNFGIQTGVQYFSSQTTIKPKMIFAEPDARGEVRYRFNCSSGDSYIPSKTGIQPTIGDSIRTNSSESALSYLQVPLLASYRISFGKISILPTAGIQTNFLLNSKLNSSLVRPSGDEEVSSSIDGLRSMYFSGVLQPQLNYKFNDRMSFDFSPNINFSLTPINKETAVKTYQNMFSLGAGLRIRL